MCDSSEPRRKVLVLGVGNLLLGDEGFGVHLIRRLEEEGVPDRVDLYDGGTGGVDLLERLRAYEHCIVCDAIRTPAQKELRNPDVVDVDRGFAAMGGPGSDGLRKMPVPGEVVVFRLNTVELLNPDPGLSLHAVSLGGILRLAHSLSLPMPSITVVGCVPETIAWTTGLSARCEEALSAAGRKVRTLLAQILS